MPTYNFTTKEKINIKSRHCNNCPMFFWDMDYDFMKCNLVKDTWPDHKKRPFQCPLQEAEDEKANV